MESTEPSKGCDYQLNQPAWAILLYFALWMFLKVCGTLSFIVNGLSLLDGIIALGCVYFNCGCVYRMHSESSLCIVFNGRDVSILSIKAFQSLRASKGISPEINALLKIYPIS